MALNRQRYAQIWDETKGSDVDKAHAVLVFYFEKPVQRPSSSAKWYENFSLFNEQDRLIELFVKRKLSRNGAPLDTIPKLISAAKSISNGSILYEYLEVIANKTAAKSIPNKPILNEYLAITAKTIETDGLPKTPFGNLSKYRTR